MRALLGVEKTHFNLRFLRRYRPPVKFKRNSPIKAHDAEWKTNSFMVHKNLL